jgi:glycosyltransferase involved in cell wall biosynthesis
MARQHYLAHGVSPERIFRSPYCVDTELFSKQVEQYAPQRSHLRHALGFRDQDTVFLFSGKLIEKKDPLTLARAFQGFSSEQQDRTGLIVVGDGELRPIVEALCKQALGERSRFVGFVNQSQLGQYYACADCLVLPSVSGETWGLVVNEALQFGIPAIVSDRVGCHPDLIVNGQSGFIFRAGDIHDLKDSMTRCMGWLAQDQARIAENCRRQVVEYTVQQAAKGIYEAVCSLE